MVAKDNVGLGKVVAAGTVATCRNGRWNATANDYPHLDNLIHHIFQWMGFDPANVMWYEGYGVYNDTAQCSELIAALENKGHTITGITTEPITTSLLAPYDILIIPQLQLGDFGTGGDPDLLPDADVQAIKSFVEGGGGLLIMEASDFGGYHFSKVQNKILRALDIGVYFQDDQVSDDENNQYDYYAPYADVDNTTWIGSAYENSTGTTTIGLYSICSLAPRRDYEVGVSILPDEQEGLPGGTLKYTVRIYNGGWNPDNYTLTLSSTWTSSLDNYSFINVSPMETKPTTLYVTIPAGASFGDFDNTITVTATGTGVSSSFTCTAIASTRIIPALDDSQAVEGRPTTTHGGLPWIFVGSATTGEYLNEMSYLKFDLQAIPPTIPPGSWTTDNVRVYLYVRANWTNGSLGEYVQVWSVIDDTWEEETLTWNNKPSENTLLDEVFVNQEYIWYAWDVTSFVVEQWQTDNIASFCLRPRNLSATYPDNFSTYFYSKEGPNALRPYLQIGYDVSTWISPNRAEGPPGGTVSLYVNVWNKGSFKDNYDLSVTSSWTATLSTTRLEDVEPNETRRVKLSVDIPETAGICVDNDNILVTVVSEGYSAENDSYWCIVHAAENIKPALEDATTKGTIQLENSRWGTGDAGETIWVGRYRDGPERGWLKFDLRAIPSLDNVVRAKLWLYSYGIAGIGAVVKVHAVDNDAWDERTLTWRTQPSIGGVLDLRAVFESGWHSWDVTSFVRTQFLGDNIASFCLVDLGEYVTPDHAAYFTSKEAGFENQWPYLEILSAAELPTYEVRVYIDPVFQGGFPGDNLVYTITVVNKGSSADTYTLTVENQWSAILENTSLAVPAGENRTTTLTVTIPSVPVCTRDNITITVTGTGVSDKFRCIAHRGRADLSFLTLYKVGADLAFLLSEGSPDRLSVKFYTYPPKSLEAENIFWTGVTPAYVEDVWEAGHSLGVKVADLVWTDDAGNVIRILDSIMVTKDDLFARIVEILGYWPEATPAERDQLFAEIVGILGQWPEAP
jgi:hypothetical protein